MREPNPRIRQTINVVPILRAAYFLEIDFVLNTAKYFFSFLPIIGMISFSCGLKSLASVLSENHFTPSASS
jgi:hypothetical protein